MQEINGTLCMGSGGENQALIVANPKARIVEFFLPLQTKPKITMSLILCRIVPLLLLNHPHKIAH